MRVAAFDIGSNTLLMLVADVEGHRTTVVADECRFGRLGQGLAASGALAEDSISRSLEILREFAAVLGELGAEKIGAVATQATRVASNAAAFVGPAEEILGARIEVISGEREAELTYRATAAAFPELAKEVIVLADVGGASTEVVVGRGTEIESAISMPIGAVSLAETHLASDPPSSEETRRLFADIDSHVTELELPREVALIGTAGTATTFASVEQRLTAYDADKVQGFQLSPAQVERLVARFLELPLAERRLLPGLEPQRADVIAAGAAIYARLLAHIRSPHFLTSGRGVRFGLAAELAR